MRRIAIVIPRERLREALVALAGCGLAELDILPSGEAERGSNHTPWVGGEHGRASQPTSAGGSTLARLGPESRLRAERAVPRLVARAPATEELEQGGRWEVLAGEIELERIASRAVAHRGAAVLVGWTPERRLGELAERLEAVGTSVVTLPHPGHATAPTLVAGSAVSRPFGPLVETYATVPYADIDPAMFAGLTYVLMFGMMFGDVGHGLVLAGLGLYLWRSGRRAVASLQWVSPIIVGAGLAAAGFGVLYGELFGPTGIIRALWLEPLGQPVVLLAAGVIVGAVLLAMSYVIGVINRWREGGPVRALYASSGIAGASFYFGAGAAAAGLALGIPILLTVGAATAGLGLVLLFIGFLAATGGGPGGAVEALVELVDAVIRTGSNAVSFARLAAFGLTHAAIGWVVWAATTGLWTSGGAGAAAAILVFAVGNALAFGLEALVAAVQSLRLEYYELFSRVFTGEGRVFRPWHLPVTSREGA
jgi:V/A-type H+-transporting ATPase subunit I